MRAYRTIAVHRFRVPGGTYFFTSNLLERRLDLLVRDIDALREAVRHTRRELPFAIVADVSTRIERRSSTFRAGRMPRPA